MSLNCLLSLPHTRTQFSDPRFEYRKRIEIEWKMKQTEVHFYLKQNRD